jgi:hypothetical protein
MVTRLALMPDVEDLDPLPADCRSIQRDVPGATVRDHKLTQSASHRPPDVRMAFEDLHGVNDYGCRGARCARVLGGKEVEQSLDIGQSPRAVRDDGQRQARQR